MCSEITWKAVYKDGTELPQHNKDGSVNKYPDIDRTKIDCFELYREEKLIFKLHLEEGRRLIVRRRTLIKNFDKSQSEVIWMVGWQWNANGRNVQDIAWVFEDGHVELTGQFKSCPFNSPVLMKEEKETGD